MKCPICTSEMSNPVNALFALPSVTSDCRPWQSGRSVVICEGCGVMRRVTNPFADFKTIYKDYKSYPEPEGRTRKILEFVSNKMPKPKSVLDIGCGEGHGLNALELAYPDAAVVGYEPHSKNPAVMHDRPTLKYDLITLFHVLEHIEDAHEMLAYVKSALTPEGRVLIQVPYTLWWPFDLVLADHWWHFNKASLVALLNACGFAEIYVGNEVIGKEITLLACVGESKSIFDEKWENREPIDWLLRYKSFLDSVNEPVAVMGTGPAAAWAGSVLGDRVVYYLDDDENRLGIFNGKKVFPPSSFEKFVLSIVTPFPDWQLSDIKAKHPELRFLC